MNTLNLDKVNTIALPKRNVQVLVAEGTPLESSLMTFGVTTVPPHGTMDPHVHEKEEEIIFIMSGHGYVEVDGKQEELRSGTVIRLPIGSSHFIHNASDEDMRFTFCFHPTVRIGAYDRS